ncbi:MAG TPA: carbohydrate kinase family protein [Chitinispirillaceae bacterium]|nr:carbohydrate kinase family protein [Chitinispirillaceae bacterium]
MKTACFSVAAIDFFPQQNAWFAGGNSLNQAVRFRQMGYQSAFIGALGTDRAGDRLVELLGDKLVDISHMQRIDGFTARNKIINDDSGERFGVEGAWESGVYEAIRMGEEDWDYLEDFDVWATLANCPFFNTALERKTKQVLSVDFLHLQDYDLLQRSLTAADIVFFGGTPDMIEDLTRIAGKWPERIIVLTLGAEGSIAFNGNRCFRQEALPLEKVIDTTGCGDAFQGGFTASYYHNRDIQKALLLGAEQGRLAAMSFGGVPW